MRFTHRVWKMWISTGGVIDLWVNQLWAVLTLFENIGVDINNFIHIKMYNLWVRLNNLCSRALHI